jgi:predicted glycosyltransferase
VLKYATLYIGEGSTTASEAVILGTPAIYINTLRVGYMEEDEKRGLLFHPSDLEGIMTAINQILRSREYQEEFQKNWEKLHQDKIDVTAFMIWFIENYPESLRIMKENPDYQYRFK